MSANPFRQSVRLFALLLTLCLLCTSCSPRVTLHKEGELGYIPVSASPIPVDSLTAEAYFIYDCQAEEFVAIHGETKLVYPASTTKLLTALYALTLLSPDERITPGDELSLVGEGSSIAYVKSHHTLTVEMLIEGMMIPSGNDAAYAIAAAAGKKLDSTLSGKAAVERFMQGMGEYAKSLGLCSTSFTVPDGLAEEEHYTSIEDLAIIAKHAFANELIRTYGGIAKADVTYASGHTNTWVNTNLLLIEDSGYYDPRVKSGKTGSIEGSYNVIFLAEEDGKEYIIGIFGSESKTARFADGILAMDAVFGT
ncbi:MAG: D-alanyl-D-alanine carboxypeptidase [Clostridia bacterium]|nr:D-alanyl-D-alanine carboxypeptidase [Clostridia bacterium]